MAGYEVRALKLAERTDVCLSLASEPAHIDGPASRTPRWHGLLLALRALFAFMPIASMQLVAQASEMELAAHAGTTAHEDLPGHEVWLSCSRTEPCPAAVEPTQYQASHDTPPVCELKALEPQDTERDVGLDAHAAELPFSSARVLSATARVVCGAPLMWLAQFSTSSALPRGPPSPSRGVDATTSQAA